MEHFQSPYSNLQPLTLGPESLGFNLLTFYNRAQIAKVVKRNTRHLKRSQLN